MNKYSGCRIEYHILQSFPVTCLNRDDVGSPKSAVIGGVRRTRVSSQCWKRQVRLALKTLGINISYRTKKLKELLLKYCEEVNEETEKAAKKVADKIATDTLVFISEEEAKCLYDELIANQAERIVSMDEKQLEKLVFNSWEKISKKIFKDLKECIGVDIALFGRMLANAPSLNVQGATSFSHAFTTHKTSFDVDYFTAVDDLAGKDNAGAGHIGVNEFSSGTFYRYVALDLGLLYDFFEDEQSLSKMVEAFTKALFIAVPSARQNTMSGYCLWDYAHIFVRKGQNVQLSFEEPVKSTIDGYVKPSIEKMESELKTMKSLLGSLFLPIGEMIFSKDKKEYGIDLLCNDLISAVSLIE